MRIGHAKRCADGNDGFDGIAALFQNFKTCLRGKFVRACNNAFR